MRVGFKTFNDRLAVMVMLIIAAIWALDGRGIIHIRSEIIGALIVTWTLVANYYFRKAPPNGPAS